MKIGIFGGTFDPVHKGHVALAKGALKEIGLDRLVFVPAIRSPLKSRSPVSSSVQRLRMLRSAVKKIPRCEVSLLELNRSGPSRTIETVKRFRKKYPGSRLYFVMGSDSLENFKRWRRWREILADCELVVGKRKDAKVRPAKELERKALFLMSPMPDVSSTRVRLALKAGRGLDRLVPAPVLRHIFKHGLYGSRKSH